MSIRTFHVKDLRIQAVDTHFPPLFSLSFFFPLFLFLCVCLPVSTFWIEIAWTRRIIQAFSFFTFDFNIRYGSSLASFACCQSISGGRAPSLSLSVCECLCYCCYCFCCYVSVCIASCANISLSHKKEKKRLLQQHKFDKYINIVSVAKQYSI